MRDSHVAQVKWDWRLLDLWSDCWYGFGCRQPALAFSFLRPSDVDPMLVQTLLPSDSGNQDFRLPLEFPVPSAEVRYFVDFRHQTDESRAETVIRKEAEKGAAIAVV